MPDGLDATERRRWRRWCELLLDVGVLAEADGSALASLVIADVRRDRAHRALLRRGAVEVHPKTGLSVRSGYAREFDAADAALKAWCSLFGVTPSDRTRVRAGKGTGNEKPETGRDARRRKLLEGA